MKIAIVGLKNLNEPGGIETHIKNVAPRLSKLGNEVHLIVNNDNKVRLKGVKLHKVKYIKGRFTNKISMLPFSLLEIKKINPDVIYANDAVHGFGTTLFFKKTPVVYVAHGVGYLRSDWPKPVKFLLRIMEQYTFRHAAKVFAVDEKSAKEVGRVRKERIQVIPNGVNISIFEKKYKKPKEFRHKTNVVFVGRLIPSKGIYDIIDVFKKIKGDIGLYVIGKGPEGSNVKKICKNSKNIHFIGFVKDVVPYLKHADIFVMPSYYEGMPIVLLEAMASKTASIAYDVGDVSKRFKNGKELIILKKGDKKGLKMWIEKLSKNKALMKKIALSGFQKVKNDYNWVNVSARILNILR